jgi:hypothetical protein
LVSDAPEKGDARRRAVVGSYSWNLSRRPRLGNTCLSLASTGRFVQSDIETGNAALVTAAALELPQIALVGSLLIEQNDAWIVGRRCLSVGSMQEILAAESFRKTRSNNNNKEAIELNAA